MIFRKSTNKDIDQMVQIAEDAKVLLRSRGVSQWQRGTYPDRAVFEKDVVDGIGYVLAEGDEVLAVCAVTFTDELSYRNLTEGSWLTGNHALYATIHRSAVSVKHQGKHLAKLLFREVEQMAQEFGVVSVRVDTHPDNIAMQRALAGAGYEKCCELILADGDEIGDLRYGYEMIV